ncbi:Transcription factor E (TFE) [Archaeoglobus sulfaticallidus PM70-1]|uniref:Transcription factor E n=1 Tax=Archaeoglobus sulfaticallidus PM70-1 TaxID=387631 RepID=N0BJP3_9EURY|nr:transcription factor E [Archaeoglobus sulfaticallidus]AGK60365.1 Transcription factor E (TFE) [Archaeoglobus sulfaticallidus PM70-1]
MELQSDELIAELIERVAGEVGLVVYTLRPQREFTDEEISQELGIEINEVRKALFSLYEIGIAEYRRKRDEETGWMEYYWKINYDRERDIVLRELLKTKRKLEAKLEMEDSAVYYICINGCVKVKYEAAMEMNFMCPRCGAPLDYLDSTVAKEKLMEEIEKIDKMISYLMESKSVN